jgi:hypothetical protein
MACSKRAQSRRAWRILFGMSSPTIKWNERLRLALSDVDETIADVYTPAEQPMIDELSSFLADGYKLCMVSGGWVQNMRKNIIDRIDGRLRHNILVAHCSGSEVWGFTENGDLRPQPFYSKYEALFTPDMKEVWRTTVAQLLNEFGLRTHAVRPKIAFRQTVGTDPHDIMYEDRGSQITLQLTNAYDLSDDQYALIEREVPYTNGQRDLRIPIMERAEQLFNEASLPITPRLGGSTAIDLAVRDVSKTTAINYVLENTDALATIGLTPPDIQDPVATIEIWGDKFSALRGGTDRHMSEALPPAVRSIDFRQEDPAEFPPGYNIVVWDGQQRLHHGLLEYLQSRHSQNDRS